LRRLCPQSQSWSSRSARNSRCLGSHLNIRHYIKNFPYTLPLSIIFHFVWVNDQIAFRDVLAPVRFFTPFPRQSSRPCGTPHVYQLSRTDIYQPYLAPPDVLCRAQTVLGLDSVGFPRDWLGKAKSSDVASSIPECSSELSKLSLTHTKWKITPLSNEKLKD